jgi:hypothetical protein
LGDRVLDLADHADEEATLLYEGSSQADLWGINLYPADHGSPRLDRVRFDDQRSPAPRESVPNRRRRFGSRADHGHRGGISAAVNMSPVQAAHHSLAEGRWFDLSLIEQLANIGTDFARAARALSTGNDERSAGALERCLELFDLTLADDRWRGRRREICRAREVVCDYLVGDNAFGSTVESLDAYFLAFAISRSLAQTKRC